MVLNYIWFRHNSLLLLGSIMLIILHKLDMLFPYLVHLEIMLVLQIVF